MHPLSPRRWGCPPRPAGATSTISATPSWFARWRPYFANLGKRLVKTPKAYVRDSGLLHCPLGIREMNDLLGHPGAGAT